MDTETRSLPAWFPGEEKPAPMPLMLVQAFVNTLDLEQGSDLLVEGEGARSWLVTSGLLDRGARVSERDLAVAREIRESIRGLLAVGETRHEERDLGPLRKLADSHPVRLNVSDQGLLSLENPSHKNIEDALFELLLIIRAAQEDGTWERLKACANPECRWAFYDRSRNHQGNWCEMAVCGNRFKNRSLRARRR